MIECWSVYKWNFKFTAKTRAQPLTGDGNYQDGLLGVEGLPGGVVKYVEIRKNTNDAMKLVIDTDKRKLGKQMRLYSLVGLMHIDPCNVVAIMCLDSYSPIELKPQPIDFEIWLFFLTFYMINVIHYICINL